MNFEINMKNNLAKILYVTPEDVHIITCVRGSVKLEVLIDSVNGENLNNDKISFNVQADIEKYAGKKVDLNIMEPTYTLALNDFDSRGDIKFS
jgi:hypothetical protein